MGFTKYQKGKVLPDVVKPTPKVVNGHNQDLYCEHDVPVNSCAHGCAKRLAESRKDG